MKRRKARLDSSAVSRKQLRKLSGSRALPPVHPSVERRLERCRVPVKALRWRCDPGVFDFRSTRELGPSSSVFLGQKRALQALEMGLRMESPGYNLYLCGLHGAEKMRHVFEYVRSIARPSPRPPDRVYVQNFEDPRRPRLLELPALQGDRFQEDVSQILGLLHERLEKLDPGKWRTSAREVLEERLERMAERYPDEAVQAWLGEWRRRILRNIRSVVIENFEVNSLGQPVEGRGARVVVDTNPTHAHLFGWIGRRSVSDQSPQPHFTEIHRGSWLEADRGILIIDANDLHGAPGVWASMKSCLKYGHLEIQDGDPSAPARSGVIKPEPIATNVKCILVGDFHLYDYLYEMDPDFAELFKVRVDFPSEINLSSRVLKREYPAFLAGVCQREGLKHLTSTGVARVVEFGVRRAGRKTKISSQSSLIADVLREADYWAGKARRRSITAIDVERAIGEAIDRVNSLEKKIAEMIAEGTILISTSGSRVGQVNGLAIYDMGDYLFGKPSRITCETSVGQGGIINIERESGFSGRSHDKGVQILVGYLRSHFAQTRPLSLTASVCFEQSYSGIDGDSASATEIYALLSSLSGLPIRQDLAVTGSLSQKGDIQPIGGVNEKIEGFFDCIHAAKPTGFEGVIIPRKNVGDLMLRKDVVAEVKAGRFHIYAIDDVTEGLEILTGLPAGKRRKDGHYPDGTVFQRVDARLEKLANDLRRYGEGGDE